MSKKQIPEEDLKLINDSFKETGGVETLGKDAHGNLKNAEIKTVNETSFELQDFNGRVLKHQISIIPKGKQQITIGVKGQRYEDISPELRSQVVWSDSDFE